MNLKNILTFLTTENPTQATATEFMAKFSDKSNDVYKALQKLSRATDDNVKQVAAEARAVASQEAVRLKALNLNNVLTFLTALVAALNTTADPRALHYKTDAESLIKDLIEPENPEVYAALRGIITATDDTVKDVATKAQAVASREATIASHVKTLEEQRNQGGVTTTIRHQLSQKIDEFVTTISTEGRYEVGAIRDARDKLAKRLITIDALKKKSDEDNATIQDKELQRAEIKKAEVLFAKNREAAHLEMRTALDKVTNELHAIAETQKHLLKACGEPTAKLVAQMNETPAKTSDAPVPTKIENPSQAHVKNLFSYMLLHIAQITDAPKEAASSPLSFDIPFMF